MSCIFKPNVNRIKDSDIISAADFKYLVADLVQLKLAVITEHLLETSYPFRQLPGGNPGVAMSFKIY
jgi:hypothetical protein